MQHHSFRRGFLSGSLAAAFFVVILPARAAEVDYRAQFRAADSAHDFVKADALLAEWKAARPDDPEYYIAATNYLLSSQRGVSFSTKKAEPGELVIADKAGHEVGSVSRAEPSNDTYQRAIALLQQGLSKAPGRIDIHLGLATLYDESGDMKGLVRQLTEMAAYANAHSQQLLGKDGQPYPEPARADLSHALSNFARHRFMLRTKEGDEAFHAIAQLDRDAFPDCEYGHNLLGVYYSVIEENPALAIENYEHALQLVPDDALVWVNVGVVQNTAGHKKQAAEAFQKAIDLDNDPDSVARAKAELAALK